MNWIIPGTNLQIRRSEADRVKDMFASMFLAGGMVLGQVSSITELEPYTIQNWVKRGFLTPPVNRRYSMPQLCRIIHINMLKSVLSLETICDLLQYINGKMDDQSDDIIDDADLYFLFVRLAARARQLEEPAAWDRALEEALYDYVEPVSGAKERIEKALRIMLTAWLAGRAKQTAEQLLREIHP